MVGIDAAIALVSLLAPPVIDFVKKKFLKPSQDTPEATLSTLATTKPDVMPAYVTAQATLLEAKTKYFNRDVCGVPSQWIVDLRASIRPVGVVVSFVVLGSMLYAYFQNITVQPDQKAIIDGVRYACISVISSWFGDRLSEND